MAVQYPTAIIIGSGFGGLGMAIALKRAGHDFLVLEKAADVGGTWRDNTYPGAACDVPSHLYSYSFEPRSDWSRKFAEQPEIHDYLRHCAGKYGIVPHIRFNTEVASARYDEASALWVVTTKAGEQLRAQLLISACGQLNQPLTPKIEGQGSFAGPAFHSARWDHSVDLAGKRVAVIGTGASAIQFVPAIVDTVGQLTVFQRSAQYIIPKPDRAYGRLESRLLGAFPGLQGLSRIGQFWQHEARAIGFTRFVKLMKVMEWAFKRQLNAQVQDPVLRQKLTPDYPMGCKRILISNDYYPALTRPNVELVTEAIARITPTGVVTKDGTEHPADVLIYGTGFAATEFLTPMQITGRNGLDLHQSWKAGAEAYLGLSVAGFPNFFMLYGPNTNLGHSSIVFMLESQIAYVMDGVRRLKAGGKQQIELKPEVQSRYNAALQARIKHTVWDGGCKSWYLTAEGKNTTNWPGFTVSYRRATQRLKPSDYRWA